MIIGKLIISSNKEESIVEIGEGLYTLNLKSFFKFDKNNELKRRRAKVIVKEVYSDIFENDKPIFCFVELNNNNQITKITEMPVLPKYLREVYRLQGNEYENYALAIEKFANFSKGSPNYMHQNNKQLYYVSKFDTIIDLVNSKQNAIVEGLKENNPAVYSTTLKQNWRLATGLGNATIYNNGFTFHPVYGIPYLTAQQIKGILRVYFIHTFFSSEQEAEKDELFAYLFGSSDKKNEQSGKLQFLDAFPINDDVSIEADIMATHYNTYYTGNNKPTDENTRHIKNKNIVIFLSIKDGTFQFNYWIKKAKFKELYLFNTCIITNGVHLDKLIEKNLKEALLYEGIGAKTAVGYGKLK